MQEKVRSEVKAFGYRSEREVLDAVLAPENGIETDYGTTPDSVNPSIFRLIRACASLP